jgi:hypothetical protein
MKSRHIILFISVAMLLAATIGGCGSSKIAAPASYNRWNAKDGTFSIDYPADWNADGGGKQGIQWAKFTQGNAQIRVNVDVSSSLVGDIAGAGIQQSGLGEKLEGAEAIDLAPVAAAHQFNMESSTQDMKGYKEGDAIPFQSKLGDGRKSPFSCDGSLGKKMRGYRATTLSHDKGIKIICICPANNWETLRPAYDKILESLAMGEGPR